MFQDADVSAPYVTYTKLDSIVRYKLMNNQVEIELKTIIDQVLLDAGIEGFDTNRVHCYIPYNLEDAASGNTVSIVIDKKRFTLRLPETQIVVNKQQKIDYDNTHPHRWSIAQWIKFIEKLFWDTYGIESVELNLRGREGAVRKGKVYTRVKKLIAKIKALSSVECDERDVVEYLIWIFSNKRKLSLNMALITCDNMVQDWVIWKKKQNKTNLSEKWRDE